MVNSDYFIADNSDLEDKKLEAAKNLYRAGNYAGALKLYLDMVNTSYSYKLYYEIGRCYYKLNDFDNAELHFQRSIGLENIKNPSYVFLGNIFYNVYLVGFKLTIVEFRVEAALSQQFFMTALLNHISILHYKDYVCFFNRRQSVSHNKTGTSFHHSCKRLLNL